MKEYDKTQYELEVFKEFIRIASLPVDKKSIQQHAPPIPDISCTIDGSRRYFELTRLTDQTVEMKVLKGRSGYSNFRINLPEVMRAIQAKCRKSYNVDGPIDLVIHEGATDIGSIFLDNVENAILSLMAHELEGSVFNRVWLVSHSDEKALMAQNSRIESPCD